VEPEIAAGFPKVMIADTSLRAFAVQIGAFSSKYQDILVE
jgi:hypothetical protein